VLVSPTPPRSTGTCRPKAPSSLHTRTCLLQGLLKNARCRQQFLWDEQTVRPDPLTSTERRHPAPYTQQCCGSEFIFFRIQIQDLISMSESYSFLWNSLHLVILEKIISVTLLQQTLAVEQSLIVLSLDRHS
jgi:hypothetical protein